MKFYENFFTVGILFLRQNPISVGSRKPFCSWIEYFFCMNFLCDTSTCIIPSLSFSITFSEISSLCGIDKFTKNIIYRSTSDFKFHQKTEGFQKSELRIVMRDIMTSSYFLHFALQGRVLACLNFISLKYTLECRVLSRCDGQRIGLSVSNATSTT